jgi:hypothetical protein
MPNPLWVDARDYLTNKGVPVTTGNLNSAMGYLAQNLNARPSYAKASPDAATSIGAGLGMPTDNQMIDPVVNAITSSGLGSGVSDAMNGISAGGVAHGGTTGAPSGIKATPLSGSVSYAPTSYTPPQTQARPQPRTAGTSTRTEKTASTRSQPKALPVNNRAETASARSDPIVSPVSTGSDPNIHGEPGNVASALPPNVNPAIPDVSGGAYAPGGLEDAGWGTAASIGGLGMALLGMFLNKGRGGRVPNAPRIPGVGASPLAAESAVAAATKFPPSPVPPIVPPPRVTGPAPITGPAPVGAPPPVSMPPLGPPVPRVAEPVVPVNALPPGAPPPAYVPPAMMGPPQVRAAPPVRGPAPVSGAMEDILVGQKSPPPVPKASPKPAPTKATVKPGKSRPTARKPKS